MDSVPFKPVRHIPRAFLAAILVFAIACGASAPSEPSPEPGTGLTPTIGPALDPDELRILNSFTITSLDPAQPGLQWFPTFGASELLMEMTEEEELKPWLLESIARESDTVWRLTLRENITFQNGKKLDAPAVVASMDRQLAQRSTAQALLSGAVFEAQGDRELTITTPVPDAVVPAKLAEFNGFPIYDVEAVESAAGNPDALAGKAFYTGPYSPVAFNSTELRLERYESYWQGRPALPGVTVKVVLDPLARLAAVQNGEADLAFYPPTETKRVVAGRSDSFYVTAPAGNESLRIEMNQNIPPFDQYEVRRAFGLAIDYDVLANDVMDGAYSVATGMLPPDHPSVVPNQVTDLARSAALLEQAGWLPGPDGVRRKDGNTLAVTLLTYPQQPDTGSHAVAVQEQVRRSGFDLTIMQTDDINGKMARPDEWNAALIFNGTISPWSGAPDNSLARYLTSGSVDNLSGTADAELDQLSNDLSRAFDESERDQLLRRTQELVIEEGAYLIVASYKRFPMIVGPDYVDYLPSSHRRFVRYDTRPGLP